MIHVCFSLYDKTGSYSKFTGTAILSLFDNTKSKVTVHLLHDNTLTNDNHDKLIQIAERYGQLLKFYNVEELCADELAKIEECFPKVKESHFSIAMFYRFFIPTLLLPHEIEKAIYLDSDIIVNLDIAELWQVELANKPLGVVPEIDNGTPVREVCLLVRDAVISEEIYFNTGTLLMNLKVLQNQKIIILAGMKFVSEYPNSVCLDQDVLNYCFAASALKLPIKFNFYVKYARLKGNLNVRNKILHYADNRISFNMDLNDPYDHLFMNYFIKTPWFDVDTANALSRTSLPFRKNYAISVVIPMYNAENFIDECLDSLLKQTFQDFEVIVVDDCSTDNSVAIVESYIPKFNGRLKLTKTEENSSGAYVPRNIGMMLARGEYIQFLDADDMILTTALENLYIASCFYDAEVVYTSSYYILTASNNIRLCKDGMHRKLIDIQKEFTFDDLHKNLDQLLLELDEGNFCACWTKFVRRDFLLKNKIFFPNLFNAGDLIWTINVYCHVKRFLRMSIPIYFYRHYDNCIMRMFSTSQQQCRFWFSSFIDLVKGFNELKKGNKVLTENPSYFLVFIKKYFNWILSRTEYARKELDNEEIYKVLNNEYLKSSNDLATELMLLLFNCVDNEKMFKDYYVKPMSKFKLYFTAKVFVLIDKKMNKESIEILSVSDEKACFSKPEWWQRNGTCHVIDSYMGELEIVAKAMVEGNVQIRLGGPWVLLNPKDASKRVPYWIDFTNLTVNDKLIFDTPTPAWNDRHYSYTISNVKANEEIKIHIEWLPHRDNRIDVKTDIINEEINTSPHKVNTVPESKIVKPLDKADTARIDVKFISEAIHSDFQIFSVSDERAKVLKPGWYQKSGIGYVIQSLNGELTFRAKATVEGRIELNLRGLEIRSPEDWAKGIAKRIPYWVDYTKLIVNGKTIIDERTPTWCDEPYRYNFNVKADEEITVKVEWMPHRKTI